jgi:PHD/YefM family antitoxin component YafN of YafNO toxin-antitoxin module
LLDSFTLRVYSWEAELYNSEGVNFMATGCVNPIKTVSASELREKLKACMKAASGEEVVLVENRSSEDKYIVDSSFFEKLVKERKEILATLEILADQNLTARLVNLSKLSEDELMNSGLLSHEEVFGA